jgi:hypothetical protein
LAGTGSSSPLGLLLRWSLGSRPNLLSIRPLNMTLLASGGFPAGTAPCASFPACSSCIRILDPRRRFGCPNEEKNRLVY